jgi:hypothetical protein
MPPLYHRLWQYLKYKVNYEDAEIPMHDGTKFKIKRGQHLTSVRSIAQGMGWHEGLKWKEPNPKTISTILEWLVKNNMIKIDRGKGNREYTLVTLMKYEIYQERKVEGNSKGTVNGEAREQQTDIKKEELRRIEEELIYIYDFWNSKKIKVHRELTQVMKGHIKARLEVHGRTNIEDAINAYCEIISDDNKYWYNHKFTLTDFLNPKNLDRFLLENKPFESHKKNNVVSFQSNTQSYPKAVGQVSVANIDETKEFLAEMERAAEAKRQRLARQKGDNT